MCVVNAQVGKKELTRSLHKLIPLYCDGQIDKSKIDQGEKQCYRENIT